MCVTPYHLWRLLILCTALKEDMHFFHAGTSLLSNGDLVTSGGRVMAVSATADSLEQAVKLSYQGVSMVEFDGMFYRRDIAHRLVSYSCLCSGITLIIILGLLSNYLDLPSHWLITCNYQLVCRA
jgi:hypothetical protein